MKTMIIIFCCFLLFSCMKKENPQIIYNSVSDIGAVSGRITTTGNTGVEGAMITTSPAVHTVYSDSTGNYILPDMPPGDYTIKVSKEGYISDSTTVALIDWRTVQVNLTLSGIQTLAGFSFTGRWIGSIGSTYQPNSMIMNLTQIGLDSITGNMIISSPGIPEYIANPNSILIRSALYFEYNSFSFTTSVKNFFTGNMINGIISGRVMTNDILSGRYSFVGANGVPFDLPFNVQREKK